MISLEGTSFPIRSIRKLESLLGRSRIDLERIASTSESFYHPFHQNKLGKKPRPIDNPTGELRRVQDSIQRLLRGIELPQEFMGGVRGRSTKTNASVHVGQSIVVTMDLKKCFQYTTNKRVYGIFKGALACSTDVANLLTRLTTRQGHLPQGAPTSTTLCNLGLLPLHDALYEKALSLGVRFTLYIDDITVSGERATELIEPTIEACRKLGYAVPYAKKRIMPANTLQKTTGVSLNHRVGTPKDSLEEVRREIIALGKKQPSQAEIRRVRSRIAYVRHLNAKQAERLERLAERVWGTSAK